MLTQNLGLNLCSQEINIVTNQVICEGNPDRIFTFSVVITSWLVFFYLATLFLVIYTLKNIVERKRLFVYPGALLSLLKK